MRLRVVKASRPKTPQNARRLTLSRSNDTISFVIERLAQGFLDLLFPPNCVICHNYIPRQPTVPIKSLIKAPSQIICQKCIELIQYNRPPFCLKCSRFMQKPLIHPLCHLCRRFKPHFDFAWGSLLFNDPLRELIHQFKYSQKTFLKIPFSSWMISFILAFELDIKQFDMIIPIPLSSARFRERGFNQSELLARSISNHFDIPISTDQLKKIRNTSSQSLLKEKERWTNIHGAFIKKNQKIIINKNILLIDDLLTTGATCSEAALILKMAGAKRVGVLTLAIAP